MSNPLLALVSTRPYRYAPAAVTIPLSERFAGDQIGYLSFGQCGFIAGIVQITSKGPVILDSFTGGGVLSGTTCGEVLGRLRKKIKKRALGRIPLCVGTSSDLEWTQLLQCTEVNDQEEFQHIIRTDPDRILPGASSRADTTHTGLLYQQKAIVMAVANSDLTRVQDACGTQFEIVRRQIPIIAMLNILLADPRVIEEGMVPVVADQGYCVALSSSSGYWNDLIARRFHGLVQGTSLHADTELGQFGQQLGHTTTGKILLAQSPCVGGADIEGAFNKAGLTVTSYSLADLSNTEQFIYASSIL